MNMFCASWRALSFKYLLTVLIFPSIWFTLSASDFDSSSEWEPFCNDHIYYKPYLSIRQGRNGPILKQRGPGFISLKGKEDLYICANGLVFLYYKLVKRHGEVYDDAVMQYAPHFCGFFNGKRGPGISARNKTLFAILLIGHPTDFRKIALQMFIAPVTNLPGKPPINFTSLAIINSEGECIIEKGPERARIRVRANPPPSISSYSYKPGEEKYIALCRFDGTSHVGQDPSIFPIEKDTASPGEVLETLNFDKSLNFIGCYNYPLLNQKQLEIIEMRTVEYANDSYFIDRAQSDLNPDDGSGLEFWTSERLTNYGSPLKDPDETTLGSEVVGKNHSYADSLSEKPKDDVKIRATKESLDLAMIRFELIPYFKEYKLIFEMAKTYGTTAKEAWDAAWDFVKEDELKKTMENHTQALKDLSEYSAERMYSPYDISIIEKMNLSEIASAEYLEKLKELTLKASPLITKAEIAYQRHKSFMTQAKMRMKLVKRVISSFEKTKKLGKAYTLEPELYEDTLISIKNDGSADDACVTLERREDQCKGIKPAASRACQITMNRLGKGKDVWPVSDDSWRDQVFELLENIFIKVCPYLPLDFVSGVNGILRGYLMKEPQGTGKDALEIIGFPRINFLQENFKTSYNITEAKDVYPEFLPVKDPSWEEILKGLEACEKDGSNPLKFDKASKRQPLQYKFKGDDIPRHVEQADKEFSLNWIIDMNFRIFATVLGFCWEKLEAESASLAVKFHNLYTSGFLDPVRQIWLNNRDNSIFKVILAKYFITGKANLWTNLCMEGSFLHSNQKNMRPLRKLFVNSYSESNFFANGPLKGNRDPYFTA